MKINCSAVPHLHCYSFDFRHFVVDPSSCPRRPGNIILTQLPSGRVPISRSHDPSEASKRCKKPKKPGMNKGPIYDWVCKSQQGNWTRELHQIMRFVCFKEHLQQELFILMPSPPRLRRCYEVLLQCCGKIQDPGQGKGSLYDLWLDLQWYGSPNWEVMPGAKAELARWLEENLKVVMGWGSKVGVEKQAAQEFGWDIISVWKYDCLL